MSFLAPSMLGSLAYIEVVAVDCGSAAEEEQEWLKTRQLYDPTIQLVAAKNSCAESFLEVAGTMVNVKSCCAREKERLFCAYE
jgi:hypothetical protein